ncbi:MAG: FecR domain-containing protein [Rhizobiales bacterium]|nr:FecR family protein [Hyphomicrobiales bacterium]NRB12790.1 FecR domain-containing protein [Hyphomicrobiales bacterium]
MFKAILSVLVLALTLGANVTYAASKGWVVSKISGKVVISVAGKPGKWVKLGELVYPGDRIKTLSDGTVALTRDAEAMIISSDAQMDIPIGGNTAEYTTIVQRKGTILFSAKKQANRQFKIRTPFAAAIVKGTTFVINANAKNMQVQVFEGSVALNGAGRTETHLVTTGVNYMVPANVNSKIVMNRVASADKVNPHFGSDIQKLAAMYLSRIRIKGGKANKFTSGVSPGKSGKITAENFLDGNNSSSNSNSSSNANSNSSSNASSNSSSNASSNSSSNSSKSSSPSKSSSNGKSNKNK